MLTFFGGQRVDVESMVAAASSGFALATAVDRLRGAAGEAFSLKDFEAALRHADPILRRLSVDETSRLADAFRVAELLEAAAAHLIELDAAARRNPPSYDERVRSAGLGFATWREMQSSTPKDLRRSTSNSLSRAVGPS